MQKKSFQNRPEVQESKAALHEQKIKASETLKFGDLNSLMGNFDDPSYWWMITPMKFLFGDPRSPELNV